MFRLPGMSLAGLPIWKVRGNTLSSVYPLKLPYRNEIFAPVIRRHSRPWLSLWESWRAKSEPERAYAVAYLRIGAKIATWYPLSHGFQPCQLPHRGSQGAGDARPAPRNFAAVIRRHSRPWLSLWESWRAKSEPERAGCTRRQWRACDPGSRPTPLGVTRFDGGWWIRRAAQPPLGSPIGRAGERSASLRGRTQ